MKEYYINHCGRQEMGTATSSASTPREQRCENCAAWDNEKGKKGLCRRFPPATSFEWRPWYKTKADDWCLAWMKKSSST